MKFVFLVFLSFLYSCTDIQTKKSVEKPVKQSFVKAKNTEVVDQKKFANGIVISWFKRGSGKMLKTGDMVNIAYEVRLKDGSIVDGNKLANKRMLPFLVGYNLQTPGWDLAFKELKIGDEVRIILPSKLARGEKGIKGLIPPNAVNIINIKILSERIPTRIVDGTKVWLLEENKSNKLKFSDECVVSFHAIASTPSQYEFVNTFRTGKPFDFQLGDYGLVPGLRKALINAKKFDRLFIVVPSEEAYGKQGFHSLVKPDESVFYNVLVMDVAKIG
jgi:FKBP-type peptidyl-prolyl cis-trans isomerase